MISESQWLQFTLVALATWRVTHMLAREDGPGDVFARVRVRIGNGFFGKLMDCFYCLSIWIAAPFALFVSRQPALWLLAWLALSGAACLLERIGGEPVVIQPLAAMSDGMKEGDERDGMLWSETSGDSEGGNAEGVSTKPAA